MKKPSLICSENEKCHKFVVCYHCNWQFMVKAKTITNDLYEVDILSALKVFDRICIHVFVLKCCLSHVLKYTSFDYDSKYYEP